MAFPDIVAGTYISVLIESPEGSGTYVTLCGMTAHSLTEQVNTRDRFVRDCADPEALPMRFIVATGKQWDLTASGLYNRAQAALISAAVGTKRLYRFLIGEPADDAVYTSYFAGRAMLTQRQIGGGQEDDGTHQLTFASDGQWTETEL